MHYNWITIYQPAGELWESLIEKPLENKGFQGVKNNKL